MGVRLLVVADDLSGAHDCAARLALVGGPIPTARRAEDLRGLKAAWALVLDAETRFVAATQAARRSAQAWMQLGQVAEAPWRFQKLDSTLRGNPAEEVEGLLLASSAPWVAVLPAYPRAGRQTLKGLHYVHGVPLSRTEFARDPVTPSRVQRPQDLFPARLGLHVPLAWVKGGSQRLKGELRRSFGRRQPRFVTFDCADDTDVECIARASVALGCRHFAGASALAGSLASLIKGPEGSFKIKRPKNLQWTILAGSLSERSFEQLRIGQSRQVLHWFALNSLPSRPSLRVGRYPGALALSTVAGRGSLPMRPLSAGRGQQIGDAAITALVRTGLALSGQSKRAAWFLTGGHTALCFFEAAKLRRLDVLGEALPGIALGRAQGPAGDVWIASKPGGFGLPDLFPRFLDLMQTQ